MKTPQQGIIVGLDIGTTQIRAAIGKRCEGGIAIIGVGQSPSRGMRKGIVINVEATADAIRKAVDEAENMAGCQVQNVVVGIAGVTMRSHYSHGEVQVEQGTVSEKDIRDVIVLARKIQLPSDYKILHAIPVEFVIDKETTTNQPVDMTGSTLEVKLHIVTVASSSIKKIVNACNLAGLKRLNIVLQSLATAETLLLPEERVQGVVQIDIGGGVTKTTVFAKSALSFCAHSVQIGQQLTTDVAVGLRISMVQAEEVKRLYGCCLASNIQDGDVFEIVRLKDNAKQLIPRQLMVDILEGRLEELLLLIKRELQKSGYNGGLVAGAILTGGTSLLPGIEELANQVLDMPVRIGSPGAINGLVDTISLPQHATAVALVLFGARNDGVPQGIMTRGGNLLLLRTTLAIKRVIEKFNRYVHTRKYGGVNRYTP